MKIDMGNNERMLSAEGLIDALDLRDTDLAQVQGAAGSNHSHGFHHDPDDWQYQNYWNVPGGWWYPQNYWNEPNGWGYPQNYWNESNGWGYQRSHHEHHRRDRH